MGRSKKTIKAKVAELRGLALDPVAKEILAGDGSVFEEHAIPIEELIIPQVPDDLKVAAKHILTLSGLSAPSLPLYAVTGGVQRFQAFVSLNVGLAHTGVLVYDLPQFSLGGWLEFSRANGVERDDMQETGELLLMGAAMADRVLAVYKHSSHRLSPKGTSAGEIVTLTGLHIYDLSHLLLDHLIDLTRHHSDVHKAQAYFKAQQWAKPIVPVEEGETWPSYI